MKVFVSWSGARSRAVAELFSDWLKCVIQASRPWISTRDIDRGAIWFSEINDKLKDVSIGIICLTSENKDKPWILFETGALAKGLTTNRVCTFLIDLKPEDLQDPLAQFNHTTPDNNSVWELTRTINSCLAENSLDERILKQVFETYWPQFDSEFNNALKNNPPDEIIPPRTEQDILSEILNNTRSLTNKIRNLEHEVFEIREDSKIDHIVRAKDIIDLRKKISLAIDNGINDEEKLMELIGSNNIPESVILSAIKRQLSQKGIKGQFPTI